MSGHAGFGHIMHLTRADLHFYPLAVATRNSGVNRAITVGFGLADVVLEPCRNSAPALMDRSQNGIAFGLGSGDYPKTTDVREARKGQFLFLHLAPDRIRFFGAPDHLGLDTNPSQFLANISRNARDHVS